MEILFSQEYCIVLKKTSENYPIDLKTSRYMFLGSILIHKSQANKGDLLFDELNSANLNHFALTTVTTRKVFARFHHVLHSSEEKNQPVWGAKLWGVEIKSICLLFRSTKWPLKLLGFLGFLGQISLVNFCLV